MTPLLGRVLHCQRVHFYLRGAACTLLLGFASQAAFAQEATPAATLHQRIDELVAKVHLGPVSPVAHDSDFVRRIYLDLTGAIPSVSETKEFLGDADVLKRAKLVDRLLADPRHAQHG